MLLGIVFLKRPFHLGRAKRLLGLLKSLRYQWLITWNLERLLIRIEQVGYRLEIEYIVELIPVFLALIADAPCDIVICRLDRFQSLHLPLVPMLQKQHPLGTVAGTPFPCLISGWLRI